MPNTFMNIFHDSLSRRRFLEFMGHSTVALTALSPLGLLTSCSHSGKPISRTPPFKPLSPSTADELLLAEGFSFAPLAKFGDVINAKGERFGSDADFIAFLPTKNGDGNSGLLWVNHENFSPVITGRKSPARKRDRAEVIHEQSLVGGSILHIKKNSQGHWSFDPTDRMNRRITGSTLIPFSNGTEIKGKKIAMGTFANCAGGKTPWNTFLTCEENYDHFYGERIFDENGRPTDKVQLSSYPHGWETVFPNPPEHYGWVVEVDPYRGSVKKHVSLGRFSHEGATVVLAGDKRAVVYMGDDAADHCLYKFISDKPDSLDKGTLFVADLKQGRWIPLKIELTPALKQRFTNQLEVLTYTHEAAILVGGTPLDRPEDIERDPRTGDLYLTLTNNSRRKNYHGSILKIMEAANDPLSLEFSSDTFLAGGKDVGFACPDNLAFDQKGNLWMCTDISGYSSGKAPYTEFGNNGLFYIPMTGENAGQAFQVASAPVGAELTGVCFSPDQKTLFISVQHPGENSQSLEALTSHWPEGGSALPKSTVVALSGPTLTSLTQ